MSAIAARAIATPSPRAISRFWQCAIARLLRSSVLQTAQREVPRIARVVLPRIAFVLCAAGLPLAAAAQGGYGARDDVLHFIDDMVAKHGFARKELVELFRRTRRQTSVLRAMTPPADAPQRSWQAYRALFVNPQRVDAGVQFWARNDRTLARAAAEYGVPEEVITAIIGVETVYGRNLGSYRVIDALATLAFDFPRRAAYFRGELEHFLLYVRDAALDVFSIKGSYAGAIGIPQFMPGSYRRFAVDFDGDGRADLAGSAADAIGSVANFLREHGWRRGEPAHFAARVEGDRWRALAGAGIKPVYLASDLAGFGVSTAADLPAGTPCALVELETPGEASEFWVGLDNFYAVTRYNRSSFYAISVLELARELAARRQEQNP